MLGVPVPHHASYLRPCKRRSAQAEVQRPEPSLRELPERYERAKNEKRIKNDFEHATAFFFRAHQKGVDGFLLVGHNLLGVREFIGSCVELVFVSLGTEVVSLAFKEGLGSSRRVNTHPAHRTEWMLSR